MKSLFKRTLAVASSSVLVLSQLAAAAVNVNVNAADGPLNIDKALVLNVPIPAVMPEVATYEGREQNSDWDSRAESELLTYGDKEYTRDSQKVRNQIKRVMLRTGWFEAAFADEVIAQIGVAKAYLGSDATGTATVEIGEVGPIIGQKLEDVLKKSAGLNIQTDDGELITVDWSGYSLKGTLVAKGKTDLDNKTVTYDVTFIDENGKAYDQAAFVRDYLYGKLDEAMQILDDAVNDFAAENNVSVDEFNGDLEGAFDTIKTKGGYIEKIAAAINGVEVSATDFETLYADYDAAVEAAILDSGVPAAPAKRVIHAIDVRQPQSVDSALGSERFAYWFTSAVNSVNNQYGDVVNIDLEVGDVSALVHSAYDIKASINGFSTDVEFSIPDDQHDALLTAILASETVEIPEGMEIDDVISHKVVFVNSTNDAYGVSGESSFDIIRVIDKITYKAIETTTTTTTTTTSSDVETSTTTTTSTTPDSEGSTTTTTTTTPGSGEGSTTTTTTTTPGSGEGSTTTTTTTTSGESTTTSTTPGTMISYEVSGLPENDLVYWSEETCEFDLSDLSIMLHFIVAGEEVGEAVDVTEFYAPTAANAGELTLAEGLGVDTSIVDVDLVDRAAVEEIITSRGYETDILDNAETAGFFYVTQVLRGDVDLNGTIDSVDSQMALINYLESILAHHDMKDEIARENRNYFVMIEQERLYEQYAYMHYAGDVADGDGIITAADSQIILQYYLENTLAHNNYDWDNSFIVGEHVQCREELHVNPLVRDRYANGFEPWT